jgi:hypothetical protein
VIVEILANRSFKVRDAGERAASNTATSDLSKEALNLI